jgi:hypothetical protein
MGFRKEAEEMKPSKVLSLMTGMIILMLTASNVQGQFSFTGPELLGRPTNNSVTVNVVANAAMKAYFEYGTQSGNYTGQTSTVSSLANEPLEVIIGGLQSNTRYYYRMVYSQDGGTTWTTRDEHSFHTQRSSGSTFTFTIIADSHMNGGGGNVALYQQTLANVNGDHPDFHLDLGDTFWMDGVTTATVANQRYLNQRSWMSVISHSAAIFVATGNHENEEGWNFDDANSKALLSVNARKLYYPNPITDGFYSGNDDPLTLIGGDQLREDYYAWEWGDALFVVIDPFQYTMVKPYPGTAGGEENDETVSNDRWSWTLGRQQFDWFKQTLEKSHTTFKFVFAHHMVGGSELYVRGGAGPAHMFEWGGYNADGTTWGFDTKRTGWGVPIRQFMIDNGVTAFFHGHDHEYAYEVRDGIVYQLVPQPGNTGYGFNLYHESDPYTIKVLPSPGHLRVTVSPSQATVDYVATSDGGVNYSYTIQAPSINVNTKIFLQGPYNGSSMSTALRTAGSIPLTQPYNTAPWNYTGSENVTSIPADVVDWVLVELRTGTAASTKVATRAAFLKSDGSIVDLNGTSTVGFSSRAAGKYYIVIRHRNHLAVMSAAAVLLNSSSTLYDFTTGSDQYYGGVNAAKDLGSSVWGMISGDVDVNGGIGASDLVSVLAAVGSLAYNINDVDMNGGVGASDLVLCLSNVGQMSQIP